MEKLSIKIMINKFIQVFLVVFFFNLLMVVNSSTFVFENFNNDIIRFLKIVPIVLSLMGQDLTHSQVLW